MSRVFVVQGFGSRTDYTNGRKLNLDASYEVIKEAVLEAGHECVRADEIVHAGTIDIPMYRELLRADLVIADLSTYNVNAAFELGVRYALRPFSTIVVAEDQFSSPFDVNHIVIRRYKHLGEDIGRQEAKRFKQELVRLINTILTAKDTDSPVYALLHTLRPPSEESEAAQAQQNQSAIARVAEAVAEATGAPAPEPAGAQQGSSAHALRELARAAMKDSDFARARPLWEELHRLAPSDASVTQQLALATYKSQQPTPEAALQAARDILAQLSPDTTNDPETLGLWGAIHKRLWELQGARDDLSASVAAYERGFYLKQDYYNGINLAFLLELRALEYARAGKRDEAIADSVLARRVRQDVLRYTAPLVQEETTNPEQRFWMLATLWEAATGLGDDAATAHWAAQAQALDVPQWMRDSQQSQGRKLAQVQAEIKQRLGR